MNLVVEKTYDSKNDEMITKLHPRMQSLAAKFLNEVYKRKGIKLKIPSSGGLRTFQEQQDLYDKGRTKPGIIVTKAKPGSSYHNYGLAIDVYYLKLDGKIDLKTTIKPEIGEIAKEIGLSWGGYWKSFKDFPHFELNLGKTSKLLALKNSGKVDEKGYVIV